MAETTWQRTKRMSMQYSGLAYNKALKPGFDTAWKALDKLGNPINRLSNKVGAEAFWPTSLDKESDKAARILRSFCKDGFYDKIDEEKEKEKSEANGTSGGPVNPERPVGPQGKQRVIKKIPTHVIKNAVGLAIFTTMRTGLWVSGAGGSGVLVARNKETGEWSPPSGILLHTAGLGFMVGVDIYDCVLVINTYEALNAFTKLRCTLGGEISVAAGPVGVGGVLDTEIHKRQAPIFTYLKSRGFYAGVQVDGTIVIERSDENEVFYGERIGVADILAGKAINPPKEKYRSLINTIKAAQGDEISEEELPSGTPPGDLEIDETLFGVPDVDDPDPYGVKALGEQGVAIKNADSHEPASPDTFEFRPSPTSPIFAHYARKSIDHTRARSGSSWRSTIFGGSYVDRGTQTDDSSDGKRDPPPLPPRQSSSIYGTPGPVLSPEPSESMSVETLEPHPIASPSPMVSPFSESTGQMGEHKDKAFTEFQTNGHSG